MKTKFLLFLSAFFLVFSGFANSRLLVTKDDGLGNSSSISELNKTTGEVIDTHIFSTTNYALGSLTFDASTNEIYGASGLTITKYNIAAKTETYFSLPEIYEEYSIIIASGRLFVTRCDDLGNSSISELNKAIGNVIDSHVFSTTNRGVGSLTFDASTNEIYGLSNGNKIIKYNIVTKTEISFSVPQMYECDMIIASGRLFVTKDDGLGNSSILELNKTTGAVIDSYAFSTTDQALQSLTYDASTNEICGGSGLTITKYNIVTKTETSFTLPETYYEYSIIIVNDNVSGVNTILSNEDSKPIRAFNLFGQEVPLNTTNQIIIIEYKNGFREKAYRN